MSRSIFLRVLARLSVLALFCITVLLTLFWGYGYRYDIKEEKIVETGVVRFLDELDGVQIYLDQERIGKELPLDVSDLKPATYTLSLAKEGFFPWEREVEVASGRVSLIDDLLLFPRNIQAQALRVTGYEGGDVVFGDDLIVQTLPELNVVSFHRMKGQEITLDKSLDLKLSGESRLYPVAPSQLIVNVSENNYLFFDVDREEFGLEFQLPKGVSQVDFMNASSGFYIKDESFFRFKIETMGANGLKVLSELILDEIDSFETVSADNNLFILNSSEGSKLAVIDFVERNFEVLTIDANPSLAKLSGTKKDVLYVNESKNELWIYNFDLEESRLLTRVSSEIDNLFWLNEGAHFGYRVGETISFCGLEMDNCAEVLTADQKSPLFFLSRLNAMVFVKDGDFFFFEL